MYLEIIGINLDCLRQHCLKDSLLVSIIIPYVRYNPLVKKCLGTCRKLYPTYEIILIPDIITIEKSNRNTKVIQAGKVTIAKKRNFAVKLSKSKYIAFIDSDAYPIKGWLENALPFFQNNKIGAVGGPNLPPPDNSVSNKTEIYVGNALKSFLVSGFKTYRKIRKKARFVNELPSCNLIVKKKNYNLVNGMNENLHTGEDVNFCRKLIKSKFRIFYHPDVCVYHKNRDFKNFVLQRITFGSSVFELIKEDKKIIFGNYIYFMPLIFLLLLLSPLLFSLNELIFNFYVLIVLTYLALIFYESLKYSREKYFLQTYITILIGNLIPSIGLLAKLLGVLPSRFKIYKNY